MRISGILIIIAILMSACVPSTPPSTPPAPQTTPAAETPTETVPGLSPTPGLPATRRAGRFEGARPNAYWGDIAWSPDGQTIAFQFIGPNRTDPIYLLDVASGQVGQVPDSQSGEGVNPALIWSPDGSAITVRALGEACPRFVEVRSGEERMRLGNPGQCSYIPPLLFLPDGQTVAVRGQAAGWICCAFLMAPGSGRSRAPLAGSSAGSWNFRQPANLFLLILPANGSPAEAGTSPATVIVR